MDFKDLIKDKPGFKKQSSNSWEGPCPKCGADRLVVWINKGAFKCQAGCGYAGDYIKYLRDVEGLSCCQAHVEAGKECLSTDCPVYEKRHGRAPRKRQPKSSVPLVGKQGEDWEPRSAETPLETWRRKAAELVEWAHAELLADADRLAYLAGRGLPVEAVKEYRLGWNPGKPYKGKPGPLFKQRAAWGLPEKRDDEGKEIKVLPIQRGYIIPSFSGADVYRIRIRRPDEDLVVPEGQNKPPKYLFLEGSGKGLVVRDRRAKAFLIVESDFDDLLLHWLARDLVCPVALTSCSIRPDSDTAPLFRNAAWVGNALDYEPRTGKSGNYENPGGQNALWWQRHFPSSERWPPPEGKDPGEAWQKGVDIRRWILDGLPIALHPRSHAEKPVAEKNQEAPKVNFDSEKCIRLIMEARGRVASACPTGAPDWLAENKPDVWRHLKAADRAVDAAFEARDEKVLAKNLKAWEQYHLRAWEIYDERPEVIERQDELFDNVLPQAER